MNKQQIYNQLKEVWVELLGYSKISYQCDFFELGGDSLLFLTLTKKLKLSYTTIDFSCFTNDLSKFYQQVMFIFEKVSKNTDSIIAPIAEKDNSTVLIFVHPLGGTIFNYKILSGSIVQPCSIFGIKDQFLNDEPIEFSTLTEQANYYANSLSFIPTTKKIILCGHSSGGTISFELAKILSKKEYKISHLIMLDSWVNVDEDIELKHNFKQIMGRQIEQLKTDEYFSTEFTKEDWFSIIWKRMELLMLYKPNQQSVPTTLLIPEKTLQDYETSQPLAERWKKYCTNLSIIKVPGNHETMLNRSYIPKIASILDQILTEAI